MRGALLLDLDGVLFESEAVHQRAWEVSMLGIGVALPDGWYEGCNGQSLLAVATRIRERYAQGLSPKEIAARKLEAYRILAKGLPPSPGVLDALEEAKPRAALVTSSSAVELGAVLDGSGLAPYLEILVCGDDVPVPKPDPAGYLLALERLSLPAEDCLAVEDSPSGVEAALGAGLRVVVVKKAPPVPEGAFAVYPTAALAIRFAARAIA